NLAHAENTQIEPSQLHLGMPMLTEKSCIWARFTIYPYRAGRHHYGTLSLFTSKVSLDFYF
ncbi:hypothetical protein K5549_020945, partial [Capra hircus]